MGYYNDVNYTSHGFIYSGGTFTDLNDPYGVNGTFVNGINNNGDVVGYYNDVNYTSHGFIYNGTTFSDLNDPNAVNGTYAEGINNFDDVVGFYNDTTDHGHGFIATPSASTNVPFEFSPEQGFMLGIPLFIGLRYLKKKRA